MTHTVSSETVRPATLAWLLPPAVAPVIGLVLLVLWGMWGLGLAIALFGLSFSAVAMFASSHGQRVVVLVLSLAFVGVGVGVLLLESAQ